MSLLMTKLKNQLHKINPDYECHLRNINVNGQKRGCSGFVVNPENGRVVYVDTESSVYEPLANQSLIRYAEHTRDYRGGQNNYCPTDNTAQAIHKMLIA